MSTVSFPAPVKALALNFPVDFDSFLTIWSLGRWGKGKFPGIDDAEIVFWLGHVPPDGRPADEWLTTDGVLAVDCGGGLLDHHPHGQFPGQCAFTRALDLLGLSDDPRFTILKRAALWEDIRDPSAQSAQPSREEGPVTVARALKDIQRNFQCTGRDEDAARYAELIRRTLDWAFLWLDAHYASQERYHGQAAEDFRSARVETVTIAGREWRIVLGTSDVDEFAPYARGEYGCKAHVTIQYRSVMVGGHPHCQISFHEGARLRTDALVEEIRLEEQRRRSPDGRAACTEKELLRTEGRIPAVDNCYYLRSKRENGQQGSSLILFGSLTEHAVEGTAIPPDRMFEIVKSWIISPESRPDVERRPKEKALAGATVLKRTLDGREWTIVLAETDIPNFSEYAHSERGAKADVVVQRYSTRHTSITTAPDTPLCMDYLAELVRLDEQYGRAADGLATFGVGDDEADALRAPGTCDEVPEWTYVREQKEIGRPPRLENPQEVDATIIPLDRFAVLLTTWLCHRSSRSRRRAPQKSMMRRHPSNSQPSPEPSSEEVVQQT